VKRVNGKPLERPEEAWEAWKSAATARELRIQLERGGATRELVIPIDGEPSPAVAQALDRNTPPARPAAAGRSRRAVVQIDGSSPNGDWEGAESY
jgi:hypothetical protein